MTATRFLLGLAISVAGFVGLFSDAPASSAWVEVVSNDSRFRDDSDRALTVWALDRFEQAGLDLPAVSLAFHDEKGTCQGQNGYFHAGDPHRIDICGFNWDRFLVTPRKVILHELAHVWVHENLEDAARLEFLHLRGLEVWQDGNTAWADQGQEHAAEIIAWALMDEEISMTSIGETDSSRLVEAFDLLTS
jgi:hypothetical protein